MFGCIMIYNQYVDNKYFELFGGFFIGVVIYFGGAVLFRFKELYEIVDILRKNILYHAKE